MFDKYIEFHKGNLPLIISVPHGGFSKFKELPKRSKGILGIDKGTIPLFKALFEIMEANIVERNISKEISYIISFVPRKNIDLNRKLEDACPEFELSKQIYNYYHNFLEETIKENINNYNYSLLVDIHGFEKYKRPPGYRDVDLILGTRNLKALYSEPLLKKDWKNTIRGKIIKKFLDLNIRIAPGHPGRKEYVLKGGYITQKYGASSIKHSQAIQIEFSDDIRLSLNALKKLILKTLAKLLLDEVSSF
ncbi:MAG: hypothetical protein ACTSR8_17885 [Promethearchaeota archaeon]